MPKIKEVVFKLNGECHECISHAKTRTGYPEFVRQGVKWRMSRYVYTQKYGEIPRGMCVRHTCDNPFCINIDHLILGTNQDNADDKVRRERQLKGEQINSCKLTERKVLEIRAIGKTKSLADMARKYGVTGCAIRLILDRRTWKHI